MTQETLSFRAGVSRSYMSDLECARRSPTIELISRLAKALEVSAADLVEGIPEQVTDKAS